MVTSKMLKMYVCIQNVRAFMQMSTSRTQLTIGQYYTLLEQKAIILIFISIIDKIKIGDFDFFSVSFYFLHCKILITLGV